MENKTIECEEFYNLMQAYRWEEPDYVVKAYQDVIDYVDKKMEEASARTKPIIAAQGHWLEY